MTPLRSFYSFGKNWISSAFPPPKKKNCCAGRIWMVGGATGKGSGWGKGSRRFLNQR